MNKTEALSALGYLQARINDLPDDIDIHNADLKQYVETATYPHILVSTPIESYDIRKRMDFEYVRYTQLRNGVAVSWWENEPLPAGA